MKVTRWVLVDVPFDDNKHRRTGPASARAEAEERQGQGLGSQFLLTAGRRCLLAATEVGRVALLIDAKNERAAKWYSSSGAIALTKTPLSLLLPLATVQAAFETYGKL